MRALRAAIAICVLGLLTGCPNLGALLRNYGFTEVRPPSTLLEPGTVVWVKSMHPFTAGVVCTRADSLGPKFVPTLAPTASAQLQSATSASFSVGADYMQLLHADTRFSNITDVTIRLSNPTIHSLTDTDILNNAQQRTPVCERAIAARRAAGYTVTLITSALRADVLYSASFKQSASLSAEARLATLQDLALRVGLDQAQVSESSIQGANLYWGIMDDRYLANLAENVAADETERGERLLPYEEITEVRAGDDVSNGLGSRRR